MNENRKQSAIALVAACLWTISCAASTCTGPPSLVAKIQTHPDANNYAELGSWFGERSQFDCSAEALKTGLRLHPNSARLSYLLGLTLISSGHADDAISPLQRSVEADPNVIATHILLATALGQLKRLQEARAQWEAALRIDSTSPAALDGLSKSMIAAGDSDSAIKLLQSAPPSEDLVLDLALAYAQGGNLDQAADTLSKALVDHPGSVAVTDALAIVYSKQRRLQDAQTLLEKSLSQHPTDENGERIYLRILVLSGDLVPARPLSVKLLARNPHSFELLYLSGVIENQVADYPAAREHLKEAATLNPDDSSTHFHLGLTLMHLKDSQGAREQFEKAVALDPSNPEARFQFASVLRSLGETQLAQEQLKQFQRLSHAKELSSVANAKASEAAQKLAAGDVKEAVSLYRDAVEATPQDAALAYQLSVAEDRAGDTAGERKTLEQVIGIDPGMALAQNQLGYLISRDGDPAAAEEHFRLAVKASPGYTKAWINLAAALAMESRFPDAQQALAQALQLEPANAEAIELKKNLPPTAN